MHGLSLPVLFTRGFSLQIAFQRFLMVSELLSLKGLVLNSGRTSAHFNIWHSNHSPENLSNKIKRAVGYRSMADALNLVSRVRIEITSPQSKETASQRSFSMTSPKMARMPHYLLLILLLLPHERERTSGSDDRKTDDGKTRKWIIQIKGSWITLGKAEDHPI